MVGHFHKAYMVGKSALPLPSGSQNMGSSSTAYSVALAGSASFTHLTLAFCEKKASSSASLMLNLRRILPTLDFLT